MAHDLKDLRDYDRRLGLRRKASFLIAAGAVLVSLIVLLNSSCGRRKMPPKLTITEADELVRRGAPIGSSVSNVKSFLTSLTIDALRVVHEYYREGVPYGTDRPDKVLPEMRGYLSAAILDVEREPETFSRINIRIDFYFDKAERLIDYRIWEQGDK